MTTRISINGQISDVAAARISVLDRGFLYGDSIYEVLRTYGRHPFALPEHLVRIRRSAELVGIPLPVTAVDFEHEISATLDAVDHGESYIRVVVTRGAGPIGLDPALAVDPQRIVIVTQLQQPAAQLYRTGASIWLLPAGRSADGALSPAAKSGNYLTNLLALRSARQHGAHEAVMLDPSGRVAEGSSSNVFAVVEGELHTPALHVGLLEGITRSKVIALARAQGLTVREVELSERDLRHASEVFLTSTLREILPVTRVDDWTVGDGQPGQVTIALREAFARMTRGEA